MPGFASTTFDRFAREKKRYDDLARFGAFGSFFFFFFFLGDLLGLRGLLIPFMSLNLVILSPFIVLVSCPASSSLLSLDDDEEDEEDEDDEDEDEDDDEDDDEELSSSRLRTFADSLAESETAGASLEGEDAKGGCDEGDE
jgi:hypothetical protein